MRITRKRESIGVFHVGSMSTMNADKDATQR